MYAEIDIKTTNKTTAKTPKHKEENKDILNIYLSSVSTHPLLKPEEERRILEKIHFTDDKDSKQRLILSNLRLVISVAKSFKNSGLTFTDLIQEGNIALMRAVETFKLEKGFRFSTYAIWRIKIALAKAIAEKSKLIRLPVYLVTRLNKIKRIINQITQNKHEEPTVEEISKATSISKIKVEELLENMQIPVSIENITFMENTPDYSKIEAKKKFRQEPIEILSQYMLKDNLKKALKILSPRERMIIKMRLGLEDNDIHTLKQIGIILGLSRERVRQIEEVAFKKLKTKEIKRKLKDFLIN